ncbi:MAG: hypothetical protein WC142_01050 [Bacteroidales bacterium]|jgi:hypothetical protein|nr:hypothetical protein [Bacteroidales bacterium]MDD2687318.1 hypothetical protein [Bacteroidales bacterium]MDD3330005.1 hypothetical protein [Bacteroidales bacterium]MDD3690646.1 hypothetical protein [Bacteroidales bacterium]MDD4043854.1 hypothetical protein [Bacteroidales bacterium]
MRRIGLLLLILYCLNINLIQAQSDKYTFFKEIDQSSIILKADILGNIYLSDGAVIYKYDNQYNLTHRFSDFSLGKIHSLDVTNPMKILVFSKEMMRLTFLNNVLATQQSSYLLSDLELLQPICVSISYDNGFWIYDQIKDALFRFDSKENIVSETKSITNIVGYKVNPNQIQEIANKYVILSDPQRGIFIFDILGTYLKTIPISDIQSFSVWKGDLIFIKNSRLNMLNIETLDISIYDLPITEVKEAIISGNFLILLTYTGTVKIYTQ